MARITALLAASHLLLVVSGLPIGKQQPDKTETVECFEKPGFSHRFDTHPLDQIHIDGEEQAPQKIDDVYWVRTKEECYIPFPDPSTLSEAGDPSLEKRGIGFSWVPAAGQFLKSIWQSKGSLGKLPFKGKSSGGTGGGSGGNTPGGGGGGGGNGGGKSPGSGQSGGQLQGNQNKVVNQSTGTAHNVAQVGTVHGDIHFGKPPKQP